MENYEQEIEAWRDRLSLSNQLTAELEQHQGAPASTEMTENTTEFFMHSAVLLDLGLDTSGAGRQEANLGVHEAMKALLFSTLLSGICENTWLLHKALSFLSFLPLKGKHTLSS